MATSNLEDGRVIWYVVENIEGERVIDPMKMKVTIESTVENVLHAVEKTLQSKFISNAKLFAVCAQTKPEQPSRKWRKFLSHSSNLSVDVNVGKMENPLIFILGTECFIKLIHDIHIKYSAKFQDYNPLRLALGLGETILNENNFVVIERLEELRETYFQLFERFMNMNRLDQVNIYDDRTYNFLLALMGAPGSGKSFFLDLIAQKHLLEDLLPRDVDLSDFLSRFSSAVAVTVTLNSQSCFDAEAESSSVSKLLGLRVLYSYFKGFLQSTEVTWDSWLESFGKDFISLKDALTFVRLHYSFHVTGLSFEEQHIILVDEIYKLHGHRSMDEATSALGVILSKKQVHLLVSSLSMYSLNSNTSGPSSRLIKWIRLDPLSVVGSIKVFESLFKNDSESVRNQKLSIVESILVACGGHARSISALYRYIQFLQNSKPASYILNISVSSFVEWRDFLFHSRIEFPLPEVAEWALCGKHVHLQTKIPLNDRNAESVDKMIVHGKLFNSLRLKDEKFIPRLLPLQLLCMDGLNATMKLALMDTFKDHVSSLKKNAGKSYERFHAQWLVLVSQTNRLEYSRELYPFVDYRHEKEVPLTALFFPELNTLKWNNSEFYETADEEDLERDKNLVLVPLIVEKVLHWGPRVIPSEFKLQACLTAHPEQQLPPADVTEFVRDRKGKPIPLMNRVIVSGLLNNPGCESLFVFKDSQGRNKVVFVENKFAKKDANKRISDSECNEKFELCLQSIRPHFMPLPMNDKYRDSLFSNLNLTEEDVYLIISTLEKDTLTRIISDKILVLGREIMEHAYTPSLAWLGHFYQSKADENRNNDKKNEDALDQQP